eukprot:UN1216
MQYQQAAWVSPAVRPLGRRRFCPRGGPFGLPRVAALRSDTPKRHRGTGPAEKRDRKPGACTDCEHHSSRTLESIESSGCAQCLCCAHLRVDGKLGKVTVDVLPALRTLWRTHVQLPAARCRLLAEPPSAQQRHCMGHRSQVAVRLGGTYTPLSHCQPSAIGTNVVARDKYSMRGSVPAAQLSMPLVLELALLNLVLVVGELADPPKEALEEFEQALHFLQGHAMLGAELLVLWVDVDELRGPHAWYYMVKALHLSDSQGP